MKRSKHLLLWATGAGLAAAIAFAGHAPSANAAMYDAGCGTNLTCIQNAGNVLIQQRINSLTADIARVNSTPNLTAPYSQSSIAADLQSNITNLTTEKATLDATTTVAAARQEFHNIFVNFRIYAVVIPKDRGEVEIDHLTNAQTALANGEPSIQTVITNAQNQGKNVTLAQAQFTDLQKQVADAATQLTNANNLVPSLTPSSWVAGNKPPDPNLNAYHTDIKQAHEDIVDAAQDLHKILQELK